MLSDRATVLKFNGYTSERTPIDNSIGQGDPLLMVLYQYYNADLLDVPEHVGEEAVTYVDDAFMLASGCNFQETHCKLKDMMCKAKGVINWSKTHSSPLEYSKLALINFTPRHLKEENLTLHLLHRSIEPTESTKYLGTIVDRHLNWKAQQAYMVEKGTKWAAQIHRLACLTWGIILKYAKHLFVSMALPRVLYTLDIWCTLSDTPSIGCKALRLSKVTRQITSVQRVGVLAITGRLRTSPTDALDACTFLLPSPLTICKWCHRAFMRMATLLPNHPLFKPVNWKRTCTTKRHYGPLQKLSRIYETEAFRFEKILLVPHDPSLAGELPFCIIILESKESLACKAENVNEEIQVFSDGSAQGGKVGAATILTRKDKPDHILHFHLGPDTKHTVYEAELVSMLLAIHLIDTEERSATSCLIAVDNQATLKAFISDMHLARSSYSL